MELHPALEYNIGESTIIIKDKNVTQRFQSMNIQSIELTTLLLGWKRVAGKGWGKIVARKSLAQVIFFNSRPIRFYYTDLISY